MKIDKYIHERRAEFDNIEQVPRDEMWMAIRQRAGRQARTRRMWIMSAAASALIIITATATLLISNEINPSDGDYTNQFDSREDQYNQLVANRMHAIDFSSLDKDIYGEIIREFEIADSMYIDLKKDLGEMPDADKAIQLAIKYHERRLRILELLEREIENQKRYEENESEIKI